MKEDFGHDTNNEQTLNIDAIATMSTAPAKWSFEPLLLRSHLPGAPGDDVEVGDAVDDEQEIHAGNTEKVDHAGHHTPELLGVETGGYEERARHRYQEDC